MLKESEIRIGVNIGKAGKEDRGITVYTRNLLKEFGNLEQDYQFVLLHYPGKKPEVDLGIENATYEELPFSDNHGPIRTMIGEQILNPLQQKKLGLDVVWHPHNRGQFIVPVGYVCTVHDVLPITNPELTDKYLNSPTKRILYDSRTHSARNAHMVITGSEFSKKELIDHLGLDPNRVVPIHYGIDRDLFNPNRSEADIREVKEKYSLPDRYLLTTGSYAPHKNHKTLVDAYAQSDLPEKGVGFVMVGPNNATGYRIGYEQIKEQVKELNLEDNVRMLPSVSAEDLVTLYNGASIFSTASLHEGFGFTPLEAMSCNVPVVVSNTSAIPEVCGDAALYADPTQASEFASHFSSLIRNPDLQQEMIIRGSTQVDNYNWKSAAEQTMEVLEKVVTSTK